MWFNVKLYRIVRGLIKCRENFQFNILRHFVQVSKCDLLGDIMKIL